MTFEGKARHGQLRGRAIERVLMALAARHLSPEEIVGAFASKRAAIYNGLPEVQRDVTGIYTCGKNPHYVAKLIVEG